MIGWGWSVLDWRGEPERQSGGMNDDTEPIGISTRKGIDPFFCMRLCYSKASFVWPYERANLESFLDGHVRAFEHFGGVPRRLAYDNLKSAVIQVGRGRDRRLNQRFRELRSWHLFDTRFCNVAKGNEKGEAGLPVVYTAKVSKPGRASRSR